MMWIGRIAVWVIVAFFALSLALVFSLLTYGFLADRLPFDRPNAFACAETHIVVVDAEVAPERAGHIEELDFLNCTLYFYEYRFR